MIPIERCEKIPSSAPTLDKINKSKSKKIFKLEELWFYFTETKERGLEIYSIDLGIRLIQTWNGKTKALSFLHKRLGDIRGLL